MGEVSRFDAATGAVEAGPSPKGLDALDVMVDPFAG